MILVQAISLMIEKTTIAQKIPLLTSSQLYDTGSHTSYVKKNRMVTESRLLVTSHRRVNTLTPALGYVVNKVSNYFCVFVIFAKILAISAAILFP